MFGIPIEAWVVFALLGIFLLPSFIASMRKALGRTAVEKSSKKESTAKTTVETKESKESDRKSLSPPGWFWLSLIVVILIVGLIGIDGWMNEFSTIRTTPWIIVLAFLFVLGGAFYGMQKAGDGAKWLTRVVALAALFIVVMYAVFGNEATTIMATWREELRKDALSLGKVGHRHDAHDESVIRLLLPKGKDTTPIRVTRRECLRWWGDDPNADAFVVLIKGVGREEWLEWKHFKALKQSGQAPFQNPGWFKFQARNTTAYVNYVVRRRGHCT